MEPDAIDVSNYSAIADAEIVEGVVCGTDNTEAFQQALDTAASINTEE